VLQSEIEAQIDGIHRRDENALTSLLEETLRLGQLVDDLHTLALTETGRLVLRPVAVALDDLVDEVAGRNAARAQQKGVPLRTSIAAGLPKAWVDPARARQVLDNLLANAVRHSPAGGTVLIAVTTTPGGDGDTTPMLRCEVTDAGPGFREDQLDQVFERFTRASDSGGSGLGLSIARDLVMAHGGTMDARNDPSTGGAAVSFTLPTAPPRSVPDLPESYELA
jgi:two-component system sensor histidine kinase BaeS